jgi:polyisoprenoid-binding protein YceI
MKLSSVVLAAAYIVIMNSTLAFASPEKYVFDKNLTYVGFVINYLAIFPVTGRFYDFQGSFIIDHEDPEKNRADIIIKTASIDVGSEERNIDIRGPDLFNSNKYPKMIFRSDKIELASDDTGRITGDLTLLGVTKPVTLDFVKVSVVNAPETRKDSRFSSGFAVTGKIKRSDFGLNSDILPIGDTVTLLVCYRLEKCNSSYTRRQAIKPLYNE